MPVKKQIKRKVRKRGNPDNIIGIALSPKFQSLNTEDATGYNNLGYAPLAPVEVSLPDTSIIRTIQPSNPIVILPDASPIGIKVSDPVIAPINNDTIHTANPTVNPVIDLNSGAGSLTPNIPAIVASQQTAVAEAKNNNTIYLLLLVALIVAGYLYYKNKNK